MRTNTNIWSCFPTKEAVFVCVRSRKKASGVVRELSPDSARDIGECRPAFDLLIDELTSELGRVADLDEVPSAWLFDM